MCTEVDLLAAVGYVGVRGWGGGVVGGGGKGGLVTVVFGLYPGQSRTSRRSCQQRDRGRPVTTVATVGGAGVDGVGKVNEGSDSSLVSTEP